MKKYLHAVETLIRNKLSEVSRPYEKGHSLSTHVSKNQISFLNLTVKMYRHMFVLKMTLCNLFLFFFYFNEVLKLETHI